MSLVGGRVGAVQSTEHKDCRNADCAATIRPPTTLISLTFLWDQPPTACQTVASRQKGFRHSSYRLPSAADLRRLFLDRRGRRHPTLDLRDDDQDGHPALPAVPEQQESDDQAVDADDQVAVEESVARDVGRREA